MLALALLINRSGSMVLAFLVLYLTEDIGFGEAGAGRMMSIFGIGAITGAYAGGRLTNWVGPVRLQIFMLLLSAPMYLAIPMCTSWQGIATAIFLMSLFSEAVRPPNSTAIAQFTPLPLQAKAFALQRMAANLGISLGPAIGGYLADIDYFLVFVGDALSTLAGAAALIYFFGLARYSKTMTAEQKLAIENNVRMNRRSPLLDGKFLVFLGLLLFASIVFFQFFGMYPLYLRDHFGLSKPGIGKLYAVNTVLIVIFEMVLIDYIRDYDPIKVIAWGSFLSCLGFGIMPFDSSLWFCVVSMVIVTIGEMMSMPICAGWVGKRSELGDRAMYMGWFTMTYSLAVVIAPTLGGTIYEQDQDRFWYFSIAIAVTVFAGFYVLADRLRREG
jgi:predicted MFS family arabinose efflux permease